MSTFIQNIINGIEEILIRRKWKFIFPITYSIIARNLWGDREFLFSIFPFDTTNIIYPYIKIIAFAIYGTLLILGLLQVFVIIGKTTRNTYKNDLKESGITNKAGKPAYVIKKYTNKNRKKGVMFELYNPNISMENWKNYISILETIFDSKVYQISFGKNTHRILLDTVPRKYATPTTISVNNNPTIEGSSTLAIGNTGSGKSYYKASA